MGSFVVGDASPPEAIEDLIPIERAVAHLPRLEVEPEEARVARHGSILGPAGIEGPYAVFDPEGALVAIYRDDGPKARPEMVVARLE